MPTFKVLTPQPPVQLSFRWKSSKPLPPVARQRTGPISVPAYCVHTRQCRHCVTGSLVYNADEQGHVCLNCGRAGPVLEACANQRQAAVAKTG